MKQAIVVKYSFTNWYKIPTVAPFQKNNRKKFYRHFLQALIKKFR